MTGREKTDVEDGAPVDELALQERFERSRMNAVVQPLHFCGCDPGANPQFKPQPPKGKWRRDQKLRPGEFQRIVAGRTNV